MKSNISKYIFWVLLPIISLTIIKAQPRESTKGKIQMGKQFKISEGSKESFSEVTLQWTRNKYSPSEVSLQNKTIVAKGTIQVYSKNIFGRTSKECTYSLTITLQGDSVLANVQNIVYHWYQRPMHKGAGGRWVHRSIEDIEPPEIKLPLEKKAYRQYLDQTYQHIDSVFEELEKILNNDQGSL